MKKILMDLAETTKKVLMNTNTQKSTFTMTMSAKKRKPSKTLAKEEPQQPITGQVSTKTEAGLRLLSIIMAMENKSKL